VTREVLVVEVPPGPPVLTRKTATLLWRLLQSHSDAHQITSTPDATEGPHSRALSSSLSSPPQAAIAIKEVRCDDNDTA